MFCPIYQRISLSGVLNHCKFDAVGNLLSSFNRESDCSKTHHQANIEQTFRILKCSGYNKSMELGMLKHDRKTKTGKEQNVFFLDLVGTPQMVLRCRIFLYLFAVSALNSLSLFHFAWISEIFTHGRIKQFFFFAWIVRYLFPFFTLWMSLMN